MTALRKYSRLESRGLWRDLPEAQLREVVVALGEASLVLSDPKSDAALTHWSLPAVLRRNPGALPAIFSPGADAAEVLEIDDPDMIAALDIVQSAIAAARPRPGRLRGLTVGAMLAGVLGAGIFWLPGALVRHTASVLPPATRAEIGQVAQAELARLTGLPCAAPAGQTALAHLTARLFPAGQAPVLVVVREGVTRAVHLPGRRVVLSESLLAEADGPEPFAAEAVAERLRGELDDPVIPLLRHAGLVATFRLLTTGSLSPGAVTGYGEALLRRAPAPLPEEALLARFATAGLSSGAFAYTLDPTGESVLGLIEADPNPTGPPRPLLPDAQWVALQDICSG